MANNETKAGWETQRTTEELRSMVATRLAKLANREDLDDKDFDVDDIV